MRILQWVALAISFVVFGAWIVASATGYRLDFKSGRLQKTAFLKVRSQPREVNVYLAQKLVATKTPWEKKRILPGSYELKLEKSGYSSWTKIVTLAPEQAVIFDDVVLFRSDPQPQVASPDEAMLLERASKPDDLFIHGGEIFTADRLITRLSDDVLHVTWYPGKQYLAYQVSREIKVIEVDGSNDQRLVELTSGLPATFTFSDDGDALVYKDGTEIKRIQLQDNS